jgi:hypothetical protein
VRKEVSEHGSVSVYLLLALTAFIVLFGILFDFLKIRMAELQAERAVKAGVRSVMSAFDPELAGYGLFGLTLPQEEQAELFDVVVGENVETPTEVFRFAPLEQTGDSRLQHVYTLANRSVFERQVLETMKYAAPIEFATELTEKFRGLQSNFQLSKTFMDSAAELEELIEVRDDQLDEVWSELTKLRNDMRNRSTRMEQTVNQLNLLSARIGNASLEQIQRTVQSIEQSITATVMAGGFPSPAMFQILQQQRQLLSDLQNHGQTRTELVNLADEQAEKLQAGIPSILHSLQTAEETDHQISLRVKNSDAGRGLGEGAEQAIAGVQVYGSAYFESYREALEESEALLQIEVNRIHALGDVRSPVTYDSEYMQQLEAFYSSMEPQDQTRQQSRRSIQQHKREARQEAEEQRQQAQKQAAMSCKPQDRKHYEQLEGKHGLYGKYMAFHSSESPEAVVSSDSVEGAAGGMMELFLQGAALLEGLRDQVYIGEYAMTYFNYRTIEFDLKKKPAAAVERFNGRMLTGQELEYILYGLGSCETNTAAAYGEMFAIRLAIRTTEALMDPATRAAGAGSPLLYVLTALAQGARDAYQDMNLLLKGESVVLSDKLTSIRVNYADHLRLFLILHPSRSGKLARIQSLIELNTSRDLTAAASYVHGTEYFKTKLRFMPALLGRASASWLKGEIREGEYEFGISAVYSY